jgi:hypothetical protein
MARDQTLLSDVVPTIILDQLQHRGSSVLDSQGRDHSSGLDFWCADMVAVCDSTDNQHELDLGQQQEAVAHIGGIQHSVDMVELYGVGTASDINTVWTKHNFFFPKHVAQKLAKP